VASVAGGAASAATGDKFENGATTAAFGYLFNQVMTDRGKAAIASQQNFYSKLNPQAAGTNSDLTYQMGVSAQAGASAIGVSIEAGIAVPSSFGYTCMYAQFCGVAGPQLVGSAGVSYSVGDGLPASGVSTAKGATWFGGTGLIGAGQLTVNDANQVQGVRGSGKLQVGAGAGVGVVDCVQKTWCSK
jgi:hypothetical protein